MQVEYFADSDPSGPFQGSQTQHRQTWGRGNAGVNGSQAM